MRKIIVLTIVILVAICCQPPMDKRSKFFNTYMQEHFPDFEIKDGEYLFFLPGGCEPCKKSCISSILSLENISSTSNLFNKNYVAILVSENTLTNRYSEDILRLHKTVLRDYTNKLDIMAFGIFGISVMKIKNKRIVALKSMKTDDYKIGFESFFATPLEDGVGLE